MDLTAARAAPALRLADVSKRFGTAYVLRNIALEIEPGRLAGLVGLNGAGKTTLIKCILDFCSVDGGTIELFGEPHTLPRSRQRLAYLPERFVPPYYLSGGVFLKAMHAMGARVYDHERVLSLCADLDLAPSALAKPVRSLSKGMTQKLGLAACLALQRDFYLFDEPMSGLDPKARARVKALFHSLKDRGKTLFFTSHSLADIDEICDHTLVLHQGGIAYSGPTRELCARYGESTLERAFLRCIEPNG